MGARGHGDYDGRVSTCFKGKGREPRRREAGEGPQWRSGARGTRSPHLHGHAHLSTVKTIRLDIYDT